MKKDKEDQKKMEFIQQLGEIQAAEKGSIALTRLPDEFYERASTYLRSLLAELENCAPDTGRTPDERYYKLTEDFRRARDIVERIYSTRERKIVLLALNSSRKAGQRTEEALKLENLVREEEELFYSLKLELETVRERLLKYDRLFKRPVAIKPESGIDTSTDDFVDAPHPEGPSRVKAEAEKAARSLVARSRAEQDKGMEAVQKPVKTEGPQTALVDITGSPPGKDGAGLMVVRALKDLDPFMGPDGRTVRLRKEDVASLPFQVAEILVKGGFASRVEEG